MGTKRRRSLTSNGSFASTGGMTSDTGITTPPRTNPSSPHLSDVGFASLAVKLEQQVERLDGTAATMNQPKASAAPATEKKRCISFACGGRPVQKDAPAVVPPQNLNSEAAKSKVPVRPCIKFAACPTRPARPHTPPRDGMDTQKATTRGSAVAQRSVSPAMVRKMRSSSVGQTRGGRSATPRRSAQSPVTRRPKIYLTAESQDLQCESSRFHEFGSDEPQEHDWIRQDKFDTRHRLTIDDTLKKELAIRRLGKEAEEEAEQEDEDDDDEAGEAANGDDVDEDAEEEEEEEVDEDNNSGYGSDVSDGYNSDNEVGFASSEDEDDDLVLWSTHRPAHRRLSGATPVCRRPSFGEHSDSSAYSLKTARHSKSRVRATTSHNRPRTPELPDSTDFVCGTLDEDRPVEEAYKSRMAARKRKKLHLIPQDIDPSFPTSGPEDEGGEELFKPAQHDSDEHVWVHGEIEDIHHDQERARPTEEEGGRVAEEVSLASSQTAGAISAPLIRPPHSAEKAAVAAGVTYDGLSACITRTAGRGHCVQVTGVPTRPHAHQVATARACHVPQYESSAAVDDDQAQARAWSHRHRQGPRAEEAETAGEVLAEVLQPSPQGAGCRKEAAARPRRRADEGAGPAHRREAWTGELRALVLMQFPVMIIVGSSWDAVHPSSLGGGSLSLDSGAG